MFFRNETDLRYEACLGASKYEENIPRCEISRWPCAAV